MGGGGGVEKGEVARERGMANGSPRSALKGSAGRSRGPYVKQRANRLEERRIARRGRIRKKKTETICRRPRWGCGV